MNDVDQSPRVARTVIEALEGSRIRQVAESNIGRDDVIPLWFGEPDLPTPDYIKKAAQEALADDHVFYAQNRGIPPLRETIAAYSTELIGQAIDVDRITVLEQQVSTLLADALTHF